MTVSRDKIYAWLTYLQKARIINLLHADAQGTSFLQKPEKVYLENSNMAHTLKPNPDIGAMRETFLYNQLYNLDSIVTAPSQGDFLTSGWHIEVGGRNKKAKHVKRTDQYLQAVDDIEIGIGSQMPLWLFGFLY